MITKEIIALICCRGGSMGIPRKNIKLFAGKPLIEWIANAAINSKVFSRIILSTEDEEIASLGLNLGLEIPTLRPREFATDISDQFEAHDHMFNFIGVDDSNSIVCNLNNNPFITSSIIKDSYNLYSKFRYQYLVLDSIKVSGDYIYYRQFEYKDEKMYPLFKEKLINSKINRQDNEITFSAINNIRWGKPSELNSYLAFTKTIGLKGFIPFWLPKLNNFDLDDKDDWFIAESVMNS